MNKCNRQRVRQIDLHAGSNETYFAGHRATHQIIKDTWAEHNTITASLHMRHIITAERKKKQAQLAKC